MKDLTHEDEVVEEDISDSPISDEEITSRNLSILKETELNVDVGPSLYSKQREVG